MKSRKQTASERTKRRANIRRGIKIALYEVEQMLAARGLELAVPPRFVEYTMALAEAGRRGATVQDKEDAFMEAIRATMRQPVVFVIEL